MSNSLPLRFRLPNPPPTFRGRKRERNWLTKALARAPIAAVWGPGGIGKSALVQQVVHANSTSNSRPIIRVLLQPDGEPLALQLLGALASATPTAYIRWSEVGGAKEASMGRLIELAERDSWCIVVEDAHNAGSSELRDLFVSVANYARNSQWVFVGRAVLSVPELSAQVNVLGTMAKTALRELAADLRPGKTDCELDEAVRASEGSPWRLQRFLVGGAQALKTAAELLRNRELGERELLSTMLLCERAVPESILGKLIHPNVIDVSHLVEVGLVERVGTSIRLHDNVRTLLDKTMSHSPEQQQRVSEVLCTDEDPVVALEGLVLALAANFTDVVAAALEQHGEHWLRHLAPRLSSLISSVSSVSPYWRLRCALVMGDVDTLAAMTPPTKPSAETALLWCEATLIGGDLQQAATLAHAVRTEPTSSAQDGFSAGLLEARAIMNLGQFADALTIIGELEPATAEQSVQKIACEAVCYTATGNTETALGALAQVEKELACASAELKRELRHRVAQSYYHLGRLHDAARSLKESLSVNEAPVLFENRSTQLLSATIDLERGDLVEAHAGANRLRAFSGTGSLLEPYLDYHEVTYALAAAALADLPRTLADVEERAIARQDGGSAQLARALREALRMLRAEPVAEPPRELELSVPPLMERLFSLTRARREIRSQNRDEAPSPQPGEHVELALLQMLAAAEACFLNGRESEAIALTRKAVSSATAHGYGIREAEARHLLCELLAARVDESDKSDGETNSNSKKTIACQNTGELREEAAALGSLAVAMNSGRFMLEAELFGLLCANEIEVGSIERLAAQIDIAPVASRRARALLGSAVHLDAFDQRFLAAFRQHPDWGAMKTTSGQEFSGSWVRGWGIDKRRRAAWLPDGSSVDLSASPILWRLIETLVEEQGPCCKESLAKMVWGESEYHPLRHDNRLHAAIRKLRRLVEDAPAKPQRIITAEHGYCVGGNVRVVECQTR